MSESEAGLSRNKQKALNKERFRCSLRHCLRALDSRHHSAQLAVASAVDRTLGDEMLARYTETL